MHHEACGVTLETVLFAKGSDSILVGDSEGGVTAYKLKNFRDGKEKQVKYLYCKTFKPNKYLNKSTRGTTLISLSGEKPG